MVFGAHAGVDQNPALHRAAAHVERARPGLGQQRSLLAGIGVDQQAIAVHPDRHMAADQDSEAAEHLLLSPSGLVAE